MTTQINYNKKLTKFFSEIENIPAFKKLKLQQYSFKLFIGGKGKGKSHFAFKEMLKFINENKLVGYLRNSEVEIKQIKRSIAQMIIDNTPFKDLRVSDEAITDKNTNRVILVFLSTKNYNKISGNETPFSMIFYDEFNQNLKSDMANLLYDFFNLLQTAFRSNKWNVWCCGNTKTRNNIIYNLFRLDLIDIKYNLEIIDVDKIILIVRYKDSLFKELNMNGDDLDLIKKYNKIVYNSMIRGITYEREDELVVNNLDDVMPFLTQTKDVMVYKNRIYNLYTDKFNKHFFFILNDNDKATIQYINDLTSKGYNCYEIEQDYSNVCSNISLFRKSFLSMDLATKLKNQQLFFNDYALYLAFKDDPYLSLYNDFKPITK